MESSLGRLEELGFDRDVACAALSAIGDDDVERAIDWLLSEGGAEDRGGAVSVKTCCPHIDDHVVFSGMLRYGDPCQECGSLKENWVCAACGETTCSRYQEGHGLAHFDERGHCIAIGSNDFSVWCYLCRSYITHEKLSPLLRQLESQKFGVDNVRTLASMMRGAAGRLVVYSHFQDVVAHRILANLRFNGTRVVGKWFSDSPLPQQVGFPAHRVDQLSARPEDDSELCLVLVDESTNSSSRRRLADALSHRKKEGTVLVTSSGDDERHPLVDSELRIRSKDIGAVVGQLAVEFGLTTLKALPHEFF